MVRRRLSTDGAISGRRDLVVAVLALLIFLALAPAASAQPQAPPRDEPRVLVSHFVVTGVSAFPPEQLRALLADGEGRELTLTELEGFAARITALYREHGYILARASVPAQEMRDGVVELAVLEGRIGKIDITGLRHYSADYLRRYVEPRAPSRIFEAGDFERGLLLLNDLPGLSLKSTLKPGTQTGTTDIVLDVDKDRLLTGAVDANNYGSPETGYERFGVSLSLNNPSGLGDVLAFRGLTSTIGGALWLVRLSYGIPLNTLGTKLGGAYTHSHVGAGVGAVVGDVTVRGDGDIGSLYILHPVLRSREFSVYGQAGFDYKDFSNNIQAQQAAQPQKDRLRVFSVGAFLDSVDGGRGANNLSVTLFQGVGDFLGGLHGSHDSHASVFGAGGTFTKLTGEASRAQQITTYTSVFVKAGGQWASTSLVAPEQYIVGGQWTVRGYPVAQFSGDRGYALTGEFRWNAPGFGDRPAFLGKKWGSILQCYLFIDHGGANLINPLEGQTRSQTITGTGVGTQIAIPDNFLLKVEYAKPMNHVVGGAKPSNGLDNYVYFLAVKWF
jgi:hemolysin activation/secretion protein